ncbi:MAG: DUF3015 family protein [Deltaproteobacteria bacterium]
MKASLALVLSLVVLVPSVLWGAKSPTGMNDVGTDSCGLGWQITQKKSFLATTTRGTTNAFVPPSFGMTFGTLGCDKHSFAKNEEAGVTFAMANQENLAIEMARGQGEYVAGFAHALGCKNVEAFGQMAQNHYEQIVRESGTAVEMYQNVKAQIKQDASLSASCGV